MIRAYSHPLQGLVAYGVGVACLAAFGAIMGWF